MFGRLSVLEFVIRNHKLLSHSQLFGRETGGAKVASAFRSQTHSIDFRIVYVGFRIVGGESVEVSEEGGVKVVNLMVLSSKSEFG